MQKLVAVLTYICTIAALFFSACGGGNRPEPAPALAPDLTQDPEALTINPATGVPIAKTWQAPVAGTTASDFCFGFGEENSHFCLEWQNGQCLAYGRHLGSDFCIRKTPVGTEVVAPADGIVRLTTDTTYGGYGADSASNPSYKGCLLILESELPNGQAVTVLLGHVQCESATPYDPAAKKGNPSAGTVVRRGQYVAHVAHYWSGSGQTTDWPHVHWGIRKGAFKNATVAALVRGYATLSEFTTDPVTGALVHPEWMDPLVMLATNGDPAAEAAAGVRHHPPGALLEDGSGSYFLVTSQAQVAPVPSDVLTADRYDIESAVRVSAEELDCYALAPAVAPLGPVTLYKRPESSTVVVAYQATKTRYDFIRWEALLSWGFTADDIATDPSVAAAYEQTYQAKGFRLVRPGTLVKADEASDVYFVTSSQTRLPIVSADAFEKEGWQWNRIVSVPLSVLEAVAGSKDQGLLDLASIQSCAVPQPCEGNCGGGGNPDAGIPVSDGGTDPADGGGDGGPAAVETCDGMDNDGNGQTDEIFLCKLGATDGPACVSSCGTAGQRVCEAPSCSWVACKPFAESCDNTLDDDCNGKTDCADPACAGSSACQTLLDGGSATEAHQIRIVITPASAATKIYCMGGMVQANDMNQDNQAQWLPPPEGAWASLGCSASGLAVYDCTTSVPSGASLRFQCYREDAGQTQYYCDTSPTQPVPADPMQVTRDGAVISLNHPYGPAGPPWTNCQE